MQNIDKFAITHTIHANFMSMALPVTQFFSPKYEEATSLSPVTIFHLTINY